MKKISLMLLFFVPFCVFSQISDNFSDGHFRGIPPATRPVEWTGDVGKFVVNEAFQLQLDAPTNGSPAQLRTHSELSSNAYWEWWMKMNFNSTSSNYTKVFLCSNQSDLTSELDGLFIRIGYTNKNVCLISQKGTTTKTLIEGAVKRLDKSSVSLRIKAKLDRNGTFHLYSKLDEESEYVLEGSCLIADAFSSQNIGVVCYFTSTRAKSFYFDDFLVRELRDDEQEGEPEPGEPPVNPELPAEGDVVFSEIMANPGGDNPEYIEFYNRSNKSFNLKNCLYYYGDKSYKLPDGEINPHEYFVLTKTTTTGSFPNDIKVFGVASFPTLANTGKLLMFGLENENLVSWFEYSDKMYGSNDKKAGGWSLECIDLENKSNTASNWTGSNVAGGTPGRENSVKAVNADTEIPKILTIQTLENNEIQLTFSKPMNRQTLTTQSSYVLSSNQYEILALSPNYPKGTEVIIRLNTLPLQGEMIEMELRGVNDLSGFGLENKQVLLGSGYEASPNEIVISEILFNPPTGGNEYVEIYNRSDKAFDLRFLSITSRKPSDGSFNSLYALASTPLLLQPQAYLVITKNKDLVCSFFECRPSSAFAELSVMPSLANASGCAVLLNNQTNEMIDEFAYNERMHAEGISNKKGIALERLDFNRPASDDGNWHSASAQSGFGTPGYQNSQYNPNTGIEEEITVTYPSVNWDNYAIHYRFNSPGYRCNAYVYDTMGRMVTIVANNELLGTEGSLSWNGKSSSGRALASGIYLVYMEVYDAKGNIKTFRKPAVVK